MSPWISTFVKLSNVRPSVALVLISLTVLVVLAACGAEPTVSPEVNTLVPTVTVETSPTEPHLFTEPALPQPTVTPPSRSNTKAVNTGEGIVTTPIAPTSEFLRAVLWLGYRKADGDVAPIGSGVVIHHQGREYLATALHVAQGCNFQPLVRRNGQWLSTSWETIGWDATADVAVLRTPTLELSNLTPTYGYAGVLIGAVGRAMGFPALGNPEEVSHITEMDGLPVPLTVLISSYAQLTNGADMSIHYTGGYVNSGFSGGAMLLPTTVGSGWSIGGIITHREGVLKNVYSKDANTGRFVKDEGLVIAEPSGLIRFAGIGIATSLIEQASPNQ